MTATASDSLSNQEPMYLGAEKNVVGKYTHKWMQKRQLDGLPWTSLSTENHEASVANKTAHKHRGWPDSDRPFYDDKISVAHFGILERAKLAAHVWPKVIAPLSVIAEFESEDLNKGEIPPKLRNSILELISVPDKLWNENEGALFADCHVKPQQIYAKLDAAEAGDDERLKAQGHEFPAKDTIRTVEGGGRSIFQALQGRSRYVLNGFLAEQFDGAHGTGYFNPYHYASTLMLGMGLWDVEKELPSPVKIPEGELGLEEWLQRDSEKGSWQEHLHDGTDMLFHKDVDTHNALHKLLYQGNSCFYPLYKHAGQQNAGEEFPSDADVRAVFPFFKEVATRIGVEVGRQSAPKNARLAVRMERSALVNLCYVALDSYHALADEFDERIKKGEDLGTNISLYASRMDTLGLAELNIVRHQMKEAMAQEAADNDYTPEQAHDLLWPAEHALIERLDNELEGENGLLKRLGVEEISMLDSSPEGKPIVSHKHTMRERTTFGVPLSSLVHTDGVDIENQNLDQPLADAKTDVYRKLGREAREFWGKYFNSDVKILNYSPFSETVGGYGNGQLVPAFSFMDLLGAREVRGNPMKEGASR